MYSQKAQSVICIPSDLHVQQP